MINDLALNAAPQTASIIGEHGFAAILGKDGSKSDGVIGTPRIDPTGTGLWIEDSYAAAIDTILIVLLEDFVKNGALDRRLETSLAVPPGRRRMRRQADVCNLSAELIDSAKLIAA